MDPRGIRMQSKISVVAPIIGRKLEKGEEGARIEKEGCGSRREKKRRPDFYDGNDECPRL
jgi:hypothetical protein